MSVRPTADRAREALFNILYSRFGSLSACRVLDVFAGTGAFGLEAISRGALCATFMDICSDSVTKNAALFSAEKSKIRIVRADVTTCPTATEKYNLIFSDAPYAKNLSVPALTALAQKGWIEDNALCLVETRRDEDSDFPIFFEKTDERLYGLAKVCFYEYRAKKFDKKGC
jgi:16S rRNA (guanine966-N2)-methyltransferase